MGFSSLKSASFVKCQELTLSRCLTLIYSGHRSIRGVIREQVTQQYWVNEKPNLSDRVDAVVYQILSITRHWWDYKLPTFLTTISNLQKCVCDKKGVPAGDYSAFAAQIENGFLEKRFSDLTEYGIPRSAILKIAKICRAEESVEDILQRLKTADTGMFGFSKYEAIKVAQAL